MKKIYGVILVTLFLIFGCTNDSKNSNQSELENTGETCSDNMDNDGDGQVDCQDQDCEVFVFCEIDTDIDNGNDTDTGNDTDSGSDLSGWLYTSENKIYTGEGRIWAGRGVNIHDTRSCWGCAAWEPNVDEVKRRIDEAVDVWGVDFLRFDLENYPRESWMTQWQNVLDDEQYLGDIKDIVDHIATKPGVFVMITLWVDESVTDMGWPTEQTITIWELLAETFADDSHVLYGLVNEPKYNYDGSDDSAVWAAMNNTVAAIRQVEEDLSSPNHLIAVQGTGGWARFLQYYVDNPIIAGDGKNIVYETHVYDPSSEFQARFVEPSATIPVIIGEFGPVTEIANMTLEDCATMMDLAESLDVPYLAWTFHSACPPNLLQSSGDNCGIGMNLVPTSWGQLLINQLAH